MEKNNYGALYVIATPIGNAQDITLRALNKLNTLDFIACEDTRITSKLCNIHKIKCKGRLLSYHEHNSSRMIPRIITRLKEGKNIGLTTDAGTPLISDPGYKLVLTAIKNDIDVKIHYPINIHQQTSFKKFSKTKLLKTDSLNKKILSLPIHENLSKNDLNRVISLIRRFYIN